MNDIKDLLDGAFTDEPPLGITREAVIRKGRGRLVRRRAGITASLGITVVATVMGASVLSGSPPDHAASQNECHPRGPATPVSLVRPAGPETPRPVRPCETETAERLTRELAAAKVVPPGFTTEKNRENSAGPLVFSPEAGYRASATLRDAQGTSTLEITVSVLPTTFPMPLECTPKDSCEKKLVNGVEVHLYHYEIGWHAIVIHGDGTAIHVYSTNKPAPGAPATRPSPALDGDATAAVAALKGLTI
jgi:hypothetical protein